MQMRSKSDPNRPASEQIIEMLEDETGAYVILDRDADLVLMNEMGGGKQMQAWLKQQVDKYQKPIGLHWQEDKTVSFMAPTGWSAERLKGYMAVYYQELQATYPGYSF